MPKILNVPQLYRSKEWLYEKYEIEKLSSQKIADIVGADRKTIDQWLAKQQIKKRGFGGSRGKKSKKWLLDKYIKKGKSLNDIAAIVNEDRKTVHRWLIGYKIPRRPVGDTRKGKDNPRWKGDKYIGKRYGYVWIYKPSHPNCSYRGFVKEHRLVAEKCLDRYLNRKEVIHHINLNKADNRPKNLYYYSSQSEHAKYHFGKIQIKLKSNLI